MQIRTWKMHEHAEMGVAAHWRYKEGGKAQGEFEKKIAQMRQLLENSRSTDEQSLLAGIGTELVEDRKYLLTPKGEVIDLPPGGTVLDFAYHVHTDVGHRCRGAKVNGRIVPLGIPAAFRRPHRNHDRQDRRAETRLAAGSPTAIWPARAHATKCAPIFSGLTGSAISTTAANCWTRNCAVWP